LRNATAVTRALPGLPWADIDLAVLPLTHALGYNTGVIRQREVDESALVSRHGLQREGPARGSDAVCDTFGQAGQRLAAALTVTLNVHNNVACVLARVACDKVRKQLEGS
jgi:hypothetical protein